MQNLFIVLSAFSPANSKRKGLGWRVGTLRAETGSQGLEWAWRSDVLIPMPFSPRKKRPDPVSLGPWPGKGTSLRAACGNGAGK